MKEIFSLKKDSWWILPFLFLLFVLVACEQKKISDDQREWSHPTVLFSAPDSQKIGDFRAEFFDETIYLIKALFDTTERFLDYSNIFLSEHQSDGESFFQKKVNNQGYPATQPVIFHDHFEKLQIFWNERKVDPEFEKWPSKRPQIGEFATKLMHKEKNLLSGDKGNSIALYSGELSFLGLGSLGSPVRVTEDDKGQLHLVFQADSTFQTILPSGEEITAGIPHAVYMKKDASNRWNRHKFLVRGTAIDITSLSRSQLIISYLGLLPLAKRDRSTSNDVLVLISKDGGITWSEPKRVFLSGQKRGLMLRMSSTPDKKVHLVWGRQISSIPGPGEMWHAYSEDNGNNWTEGKAFIKLESSSKTVWHFVLSHDMISDQYGRIHWIGVVAKKDDKGAVNTLHYSMWNPSTKSWEKNYDLNISDHPAQVQMSIDKISQKLYIVWSEPLNGKLLYITKQLSEL